MKSLFLFLEVSCIIILYSCKGSEKIDQFTESMDLPAWIRAIHPDNIVGEGFGWTYSQAKDSAMSDIRLQISKTIAYSCMQFDQLTVSNSVINNSVITEESFIRQFFSQTYSPIISGISIQKATNYFDEVQYYPEGKIIHYYIQYPYSQEDLLNDINAWKKIFNEFTDRIEEVISNKKAYSSIDEILGDIHFFQQNQLLYDGQLQMQIETALNQLFSLMATISVKCNLENKGVLQVNLMQNNKPISYSRSPKVFSNCFGIQNIENSGNYWRVHFIENQGLCTNGNSEIEIEFDVSPATPIISTYNVGIANDELDLSVCDPVSVSVINRTYERINVALFFLRLTSTQNSRFKLVQLEFVATRYYKSYWSGNIIAENLTPVIITDINKEFTGKGIFQIDFQCNCNMDMESYSSASINPTISGSLYVQSLINGDQRQIEFKDINLLTTW